MATNLGLEPARRIPSMNNLAAAQAVGANYLLTGSGTPPAYGHVAALPAGLTLVAGLGGAARARFRFVHPANPGVSQTVRAVLLRPSPVAAAQGPRATATAGGAMEVIPLCEITLAYGGASVGFASDIFNSADRLAVVNGLSIDPEASAMLSLVGGGSIDVIGNRDLVLGSFIRGSLIAFDARQASGTGSLAALYETYEY
jgi:hypothetical protein